MPFLSRLLRAGAAAAVAVSLAEAMRSASGGGTATPLPGTAPYSAALQVRLQRAVAARGSDYRPRTRHRNADGSARYTNRLILEASPYLLQHAHNPVDWYPWGDEAFARARREGKPVLLSVGYSTCHWCHVMEEESFEDEEIAAFLNRHYVAIKVDRERRPDVDGVYMTAVQLMSGDGGWPMTVWLTPDRKPFYGGTYFPPRDGDRGVRFGFLSLLARLHEAYEAKPDDVLAAAADVADRVRRSVAATPGDLPGPDLLRRAYAELRGAFDATAGGFGRAPKFPRSVQLEFLLRYHRRTGEPEARAMVERTLEAMAAGGIHDHVGGGFHRYATDAAWLVPHFEKMLYDNALLAVAYLEAHQVTGREDFAVVARDTLDYVTRDMTAPDGGFYAATDADSEGEEGRYFLWRPEELAAALDPETLRVVTAYYAVEPEGNFAGRSILHTPRPLAEVAGALGLDTADAERRLVSARRQLLSVRAARVPPHTDRKVITAWNGLMISAFARGAQTLGEARYTRAAAQAAGVVLADRRDGGRLRRSRLDGEASGEAYLDDYAFLIAGLLDLYEASSDPRWLREALALQETQTAHYWDEGQGGFFLTADDAEQPLAREKPAADGAEPAGNSVALLNLLRLAELTTDDRFRHMAEQGLRAVAGPLGRRPTVAPRLLGAVDFLTDAPKAVVIVTPDGSADAEPLLAELRRVFVPNGVVTVLAEHERDALAPVVPLVSDKRAVGGRPTAYVCERRVCKLPTASPAVLREQLARVEPLPGPE